MKNSILLLYLFLSFVIFSCHRPYSNFETTLPSPDLKTHIYFNLNNGELYYLVYFNNKKLINWSKLGYQDHNQNFLGDLVLTDYSSKSELNRDDELWNEFLFFRKSYNEIKYHLRTGNSQGLEHDLVFRSFDEGFAFRYEFPKQSNVEEMIYEHSEINFESDSLSCYIQTVQNSAIVDSQEFIELPYEYTNQDGIFISVSESCTDDHKKLNIVQSESDNCALRLIQNRNSEELKNGYKTPWRIVYFSN